MHSRLTSGRARPLTRLAAPLLIALVAGLVSPAAAMAAKGGGPKAASVAGSSIALNQAGQALHVGDTVTFTTAVAPLNPTEYPMVVVQCYSNADGSLLYGMLDHTDAGFLLGGGTSWTSGPAHCVGHLYSYPSVTELAAPVAFDVQG